MTWRNVFLGERFSLALIRRQFYFSECTQVRIITRRLVVYLQVLSYKKLKSPQREEVVVHERVKHDTPRRLGFESLFLNYYFHFSGAVWLVEVLIVLLALDAWVLIASAFILLPQ